jgi:hypothetical protein
VAVDSLADRACSAWGIGCVVVAMRRAARVDANHAEIIDALRSVGCSVLSLAPIGKSCPDILCGIAGRTFLAELKDGSQPPSKQRLTPGQHAWHEAWNGGPVWVIRSVDQALDVVARIRA